MADEPDRRITQSEAERIWRRAAELQSAAAERNEAQLRHRALQGAHPVDGLSIADVREAALGAGIAPEHIEYALAEIESDARHRPGHGGRLDRLADRFLGQPPDAIEVVRTIHVPVERVFESMQRVFPNPPFGLVLSDTRGRDLTRDGVLVFSTDVLSHTSSFQWALEVGDVKQIFVTLRRVGEVEATTQVVARSPLTRRRINLAVGGATSGVAGAGGVAAGLFGGSALAAAMGVAGVGAITLAAAPAAAAGVLGFVAMRSGYRRLYRWASNYARSALERLLQALAVDVQTQGAFARKSGLPATSTDEL